MLIAMDAADPDLVRRWASEGRLPAVASMLARGTAAEVAAPPGVFVTSNWASIATAVGPDRHRYLCWDEIDPETYEHRETEPTPATVQGTAFWEHLSTAGRRTALVDVPHTWPSPIDGVMVVEWGCHDRHAGTRSWPEGLISELDELTGGHLGEVANPDRDQFAPCDYLHRTAPIRSFDEEVRLLEDLRVAVERKRQASLHLLDQGDWDVFVSVLGESHCAGHQLWHHHDPSHPRHDPSARRAIGVDPVLDLYQRVDAVIGDHLDRLGPDDTAYLLLPHGMVAHHDGTHLLDPVLANLDRSLDRPEQVGRATRLASVATSPLPISARRRAARWAAPLVRRRLASAPAQEHSVLPAIARRRWYAAPNNTVSGGVRLNLAGREGQGRIHPGARDEVLHWLIDRLSELVNVDTGGPVVAEVTIADDIYQRRPDDLMPDLFVEWVRDDPIERVWSPATGTVVRPYTHWRTGDHVPVGLLVAAGPGIAAGATTETIDSIDIAPTVSRSVGVELPDVDGRAIAALLPAGQAAAGVAGPARWARATRSHPGLRRSLTALERRAATARAHGLDHWEVAGAPRLDSLRAELDALAAAHHRTHEELRRGQAAIASLQQQVVDLGREAAITRTTAWLRLRPSDPEPKISVIIPTRDRAGVLGGAIDSVRNQTHANWELLVVDDHSRDATPALLAAIDEPRLRVLASRGAGVAAARNTGLDHATGDVVVYLDDDNRYDPDWLKAVAWAFSERPTAGVGFGARLVDDQGRHHGGSFSGQVWMQQLPWDREAVQEFNRVDMNVLAHRRNGARFDPQLSFYADWDLLLALTVDEDPFEITAIAAHYTTTEPTRLTAVTEASAQDAEYRRIRAKARTDDVAPGR
ncbi:MAG: type phosphodiesterase/nucleotide pyrophosphatase [Acidimicrobiales bacterium]|nr:type phosphodiesterase/nucleotide pyrophosphatase [Acidimicrobiales bacterium]